MGSDVYNIFHPKDQNTHCFKCAYMNQDNHIFVHKINFNNIKELKS